MKIRFVAEVSCVLIWTGAECWRTLKRLELEEEGNLWAPGR